MTEEEMQEIDDIHLEAHEHDDDEIIKKPVSNVLSIGSICANKWWLGMKCGCTYIPFPLDNVENHTVYQFENLRMLLEQDFKQIRPDALQYMEQEGMRIVDGMHVCYHGYKYIGDELHRPLVFAHFFDTGDGKTYLDETEAWNRWNHKVEKTLHVIKDLDTPLNLVSYRREDADSYYKRDYLLRSARRLVNYIKTVRKAPFKLISLIEAITDKESIEANEANLTQVVFPAGAQKGKSYWLRAELPRHLDALKEHLI